MPSIFIQHVSRKSKLSGTEAENIYIQEPFPIVQFSLLRLEENILGVFLCYNGFSTVSENWSLF